MSNSLLTEAAGQVGHPPVDQVLRFLCGPAQELADLRHAVSLKVQGDGVAAGCHHAAETVADGPACLASGRSALGVGPEEVIEIPGLGLGMAARGADAAQADQVLPSSPEDFANQAAHASP